MNKFLQVFSQYHPIVNTLLFGTMILAIGNSISILYFPLYLVKEQHFDPVKVALIVGVGSLAATFSGFIAGFVSDFIGRRKVMLGSLYVSSFIFFGFMLSKQVYFLILMMLLQGVSTSFFAPVSKALAADLTAVDRRMRVFSIRYTINNIGYAIGPPIGAYLWLKETIDPFLVTGCLYGGYSILLHILLNKYGIKQIEGEQLKESATIQGAFCVIKYDKVLFFLVFGGLVSTTVYGQWSVTMQQYLNGHFTNGTLLYTSVLTVNSVCVILFQYPISRWAERFKPLTIVVAGSLLFSIGMGGFAFSTTWFSLILFMVIFTIGETMVIPSEYMMIDQITPNRLRGMYYGAQNLTGVGNFFGPLVGGYLLLHFGGSVMFLSFALLGLISIFFFWRGQTIQDRKSINKRSNNIVL